MNDREEPSKLGSGERETRDFRSSDLLSNESKPLESIRIGRYEIRKQLNKGGFEFVLLADDPSLKRPVAIKVPRWDTNNGCQIH